MTKMLADDEVAFLVVYVILMVLITVGNLYIIIVVCWKSDLSNSKNVHLVSLACSDLLVGIFVIPNVITMRYSFMDWSKSWCLLCLYLEHAASAACMLTVSAMAVDRYQILVYPLKSRLHKRETVIAIIAIVWIISFVYGVRVPVLYDIDTKLTKSEGQIITKFSCTVKDSSDFGHQIVTILDCVILFVIPVAVLASTNIIVSFKLTQTNTSATSKEGFKKRKKAIRLLLLMVLIFTVSHVPSFAARFHKTVVDKKMTNYKYIGMSFQVLSWSSSFINVLFYGSLNDEVKEVGSKIRRTIAKHCCPWKWSRVHPESASQGSSGAGKSSVNPTTGGSTMVTRTGTVNKTEQV